MAEKSVKDKAVRSHACDICGEAFLTKKAMEQHRRRKHDVRSQFQDYVGEAGVCPVCGKQFGTRLRCVAHLCDARHGRGKLCQQVILEGLVPKNAPEENARLDEIDSKLRAMARKSGLTQPKVANSMR